MTNIIIFNSTKSNSMILSSTFSKNSKNSKNSKISKISKIWKIWKIWKFWKFWKTKWGMKPRVSTPTYGHMSCVSVWWWREITTHKSWFQMYFSEFLKFLKFWKFLTISWANFGWALSQWLLGVRIKTGYLDTSPMSLLSIWHIRIYIGWVQIKNFFAEKKTSFFFFPFLT